MTGDKPDPRLRTPMHWSPGRAAGFTTGLPWEPLQPDSATATVASQDPDPTSLLNHFRRLIHLRGESPALATGRLIPLQTSDTSVAAFLRREGDRAVLVVTNLSERAKADVVLFSRDSVLAAGRYRLEPRMGGTSGITMRVQRDGRIGRQVPVARLEPLTGLVWELVRDR